ncbi:MAG: Maf family protein [Oscillospiraceae bacterium]|jgi:septum formation protein
MLILASGSPRRRELLEYISSDFAIITKPTDESFPTGVPPRRGAELLALRKARAVAEQYPCDVVIGADTIVVLEGEIFGKPQDAADATRMLQALSGREHTVYTGVAVLSSQGEQVFSEGTQVRFLPLSPEEIKAYVDSGEPMDKAGAYGIQGKGALLVEGITGDFYNVMGLPVCRLGRVLSAL